MKKIHSDQKKFRTKRQRALEIRRRLQKIRFIRIKRFKHLIKVEGTYVNFTRIQAPKVFTLKEGADRITFLSFLANLRYTVGLKKQNVLIDFSETAYLIADATLLFYAEVTRLVRNFGHIAKIRCNLPRNSHEYKRRPIIRSKEKVAQVLKQIGVLELLGNQAVIRPTYEDVVHWRAAHGYIVENDLAEPILSVIDKYIGKMVSKSLYSAISEAITNSSHHAYQDTRSDGLNILDNSGWWLFLQIKDDVLNLLICDLEAAKMRFEV